MQMQPAVIGQLHDDLVDEMLILLQRQLGLPLKKEKMVKVYAITVYTNTGVEIGKCLFTGRRFEQKQGVFLAKGVLQVLNFFEESII